MRTLTASALCLIACGPAPLPETLVTGLRVLSIVDSPPEVAPGQSAGLSILELDPSRPGGKTTVLWVGCQPDNLNLGRGACSDTSALLQPTAFSSFPPGVSILGFGTMASYTPAADLFSTNPPDDPIRQNGTVGQVLAVVIGEEVNPTADDAELRALFTRIENQEVKTVLALTRITVSEHTPQNQNPHLDTLSIDGALLPSGAVIQLEPGQQVALHATGGDRETYTLVVPDGQETRLETLVGAWYSSGGRFDSERFNLDTDPDSHFTAPGSPDIPEDPVSARRTGTVWLVLRDDRGGQAFQTFPFFVCDDTLPAPSVSSVTSPTTAEGSVALSGMNLSSVLDVVVGGIALGRGSFSSVNNTFTGAAPMLPSGTYPVSVRTKTCTTVDTGQTVTLP